MRSLIVSVVGTVLAGVLLYYFTLEKPELIYTLSDPITLIPEEKNSKIGVQQLEVKNVGDREAKKIRTFIAVPVLSFEMVKHSKADDVKIFPSEDSLEINYAELPSEGSFKVTLKSVGVSKAFLRISHSGGTAKDATEIRQWTSSDILSWGLFVVYLFAAWFMIRSGLLDSWESKPRWSPEIVLKKGRKPFYMKSEKWSSLRERAIGHMIEKDERIHYSNYLQDSAALKLLSNQKPEYLSDEEWNYAATKAAESVKKEISSNATSAYKPDDLLKSLEMARPLHFPQDTWLKLQEKLNDSYIALRRRGFSQIDYSAEKMIIEINSPKPEGLRDELWSDYIQTCKHYLFSAVSSRLELKDDPIKYLQSLQIGVLDDESVRKLRNRAYSLAISTFGDLDRLRDAQDFIVLERPAWIKDEDYNELYSKAEKTVKLDADISRNASLLDLFKGLLSYRPLPEKKPNLITEEEWATFVQMDNELRVKKEKNQELEYLTKEKEEKATNFLAKVEKQLEIIHVFLNDPTVVDRVEEYSSSFAQGNLENLKKLAKLMRDKMNR